MDSTVADVVGCVSVALVLAGVCGLFLLALRVMRWCSRAAQARREAEFLRETVRELEAADAAEAIPAGDQWA